MKPSATSLFCSSCKKRKKLPFCEANKFRDAYEKSEESRAWRLLHNVVQILEKLVLRRKNDATANPSGRKAVKDVEDNESDEETCPPMIASNDCRNGCVINRRRSFCCCVKSDNDEESDDDDNSTDWEMVVKLATVVFMISNLRLGNDEVQADEIKSASSNHDMADSVEGDATPFASLIQTENGRHPLTVFEEGNCKHDQPSATVSRDLSQVLQWQSPSVTNTQVPSSPTLFQLPHQQIPTTKGDVGTKADMSEPVTGGVTRLSSQTFVEQPAGNFEKTGVWSQSVALAKAHYHDMDVEASNESIASVTISMGTSNALNSTIPMEFVTGGQQFSFHLEDIASVCSPALNADEDNGTVRKIEMSSPVPHVYLGMDSTGCGSSDEWPLICNSSMMQDGKLEQQPTEATTLVSDSTGDSVDQVAPSATISQDFLTLGNFTASLPSSDKEEVRVAAEPSQPTTIETTQNDCTINAAVPTARVSHVTRNATSHLSQAQGSTQVSDTENQQPEQQQQENQARISMCSSPVTNNKTIQASRLVPSLAAPIVQEKSDNELNQGSCAHSDTSDPSGCNVSKSEQSSEPNNKAPGTTSPDHHDTSSSEQSFNSESPGTTSSDCHDKPSETTGEDGHCKVGNRLDAAPVSDKPSKSKPTREENKEKNNYETVPSPSWLSDATEILQNLHINAFKNTSSKDTKSSDEPKRAARDEARELETVLNMLKTASLEEARELESVLKMLNAASITDAGELESVLKMLDTATISEILSSDPDKLVKSKEKSLTSKSVVPEEMNLKKSADHDEFVKSKEQCATSKSVLPAEMNKSADHDYMTGTQAASKDRTTGDADGSATPNSRGRKRRCESTDDESMHQEKRIRRCSMSASCQLTTLEEEESVDIGLDTKDELSFTSNEQVVDWQQDVMDDSSGSQQNPQPDVVSPTPTLHLQSETEPLELKRRSRKRTARKSTRSSSPPQMEQSERSSYDNDGTSLAKRLRSSGITHSPRPLRRPRRIRIRRSCPSDSNSVGNPSQRGAVLLPPVAKPTANVRPLPSKVVSPQLATVSHSPKPVVSTSPPPSPPTDKQSVYRSERTSTLLSSLRTLELSASGHLSATKRLVRDVKTFEMSKKCHQEILKKTARKSTHPYQKRTKRCQEAEL